ncbi:hypothetical protein PanWU01x14_288770 [Parasponia andersonii]|uniref:Uncharacterized protein n=1 Tax=Parasponia andersonii TaxID=3476 RepID=A0A2P5AYA3_PARAD|nr:hypothetical protein PanWU01x14_288770 [Parasponia andersonii]
MDFVQTYKTSAIQLTLKIETQLNKKTNRNPITAQSSSPPQRSDLSKVKAMDKPHDEAVRPTPSHNQSTARPQKEVANNNTNNPYAVPRDKQATIQINIV